MNIRKFSIGNWILYRNKPFQIEHIVNNNLHLRTMSEFGYNIYFHVENNEDIRPIDISHTILLNNNFVYDDAHPNFNEGYICNYEDDVDIYIKDDLTYIEICKEGQVVFMFKSYEILKVNEIQNALTMCNLTKYFYF